MSDHRHPVLAVNVLAAVTGISLKDLSTMRDEALLVDFGIFYGSQHMNAGFFAEKKLRGVGPDT